MIRNLCRDLLLSLVALPIAVSAAGTAKHVVIVVFDGMRPDFITDAAAPTLTQLSREGVFFQNNHSVFLTSTEVNGTALATSSYPMRSGLMANVEFRPKIDPLAAVGTEVLSTIRRGDQVTDGHYLAVPTIVEAARAAGKSAVVAGTKPVAMLWDRADRQDEDHGVTVFEGKSLPASVAKRLIEANGPFPPTGNQEKHQRDDWTTQALVEQLWAKGVPDLSVLWLAEPDYTQHATGPGSPASLQSIRNSDANLKRVLDALEKKGVRGETDVFVVSDHAFSTIGRTVDVAVELSKAGFTTARKFVETPNRDTVLVVGNGDVACLYVVGKSPETIRKITEWFQQQDFTGVIFTRDALPGTFSLAQAKIETSDAPDLVVSLRWWNGRSDNGTPGLTTAEGNSRKPGQGNHTGLSRFNVRNTLIGAGPDLRRGINNPLPTGNVDLGATVLWLLGVPLQHSIDGRVLSEALVGEVPPLTQVKFERLEAKTTIGNTLWTQYLHVSEINGVLYLDEGNGAQSAAP